MRYIKYWFVLCLVLMAVFQVRSESETPLKQILYVQENEIWQLNSETLERQRIYVGSLIIRAKLSPDEHSIYLIEGQEKRSHATDPRQLVRLELATGRREVLFERTGLVNLYPDASHRLVIIVYMIDEANGQECLLEIATGLCADLPSARSFYWHNNDVVVIRNDHTPVLLDLQTLDFIELGLPSGEWSVLLIKDSPKPDEVLLVTVQRNENTKASTYNLVYTLNTKTHTVRPFRFNGVNDANSMMTFWATAPSWKYVAYESMFNFFIVDGGDGHVIRQWPDGTLRPGGYFLAWLSEDTLFFASGSILGTYVIGAPDPQFLQYRCQCEVFAAISQPVDGSDNLPGNTSR